MEKGWRSQRVWLRSARNVGHLTLQLAPADTEPPPVVDGNDDFAVMISELAASYGRTAKWGPMNCLIDFEPSDVACLEWDEGGCMFISKAEPGTYLEADEENDA